MFKFVSMIALMVAVPANAQTVAPPSTPNVYVPAGTVPCVAKSFSDEKAAQRLIRELRYQNGGDMIITVTRKAKSPQVVYEGNDQVRPALNASKVAQSGCN